MLRTGRSSAPGKQPLDSSFDDTTDDTNNASTTNAAPSSSSGLKPSPVSSTERALMYGVCAMAISLLHSFFVSFYVDYYVRQFLSTDGADQEGGNPHSSSSGGGGGFGIKSFVFGQVIYAVWNSANDMGFGWYGDTSYTDVARRRLGRIAVGGPLWALVFCCMWLPIRLPWVPAVAQFTLTLVLYDGFFSFTTVAFRALLTDITSSPSERAKCNAYAAVFHVIGSIGIGFASYLFEEGRGSVVVHSNGGGREDNDGLLPFRVFAVVTSAISAALFLVSSSPRYKETTLKMSPTAAALAGSSSRKEWERDEEEQGGLDDGGKKKAEPPTLPQQQNLKQFLQASIKRTNVVVALVVWCFQEYACTFATNFFSLFLVTVSGDVFSPLGRSILVQLSFVLPHFGTLLLTPLVPIFGLRGIVRSLFAARFALCLYVVALSASSFPFAASADETSPPSSIYAAATGGGSLFSRNAKIIFALCLLFNRVLTEAVCRLQPLVLSDLVDEDVMLHDRPNSMTAAIHGMTALAARPSQSLAPVLSCAYLMQYTDLFGGGGGGGGMKAAAPPASSAAASPAVVWLVGISGLVTCGAMFLAWQYYALHGKHLTLVRRYMEKRSTEHDGNHMQV